MFRINKWILQSLFSHYTKTKLNPVIYLKRENNMINLGLSQECKRGFPSEKTALTDLPSKKKI